MYNMKNMDNTFRKISQSNDVGGYRIGKLESGYIQFNLTHKPNWFHRQMMKLCLGWYWFDNK
jgi:hypothetical protein